MLRMLLCVQKGGYVLRALEMLSLLRRLISGKKNKRDNMSVREWYLREKSWIDDLLHGHPMQRQINQVSYIINNKDASISLRRKMLANILAYAKANTKFYAGIKGCNLQDFPVVSKKDIMANADAFNVPDDKIPGQKGPVHVQRTSGSTGTPFEFRQDSLCRIRRIATIKAANELIGFRPFMPLMHLRAVKHYWGFPNDLTWKRDLNILYADNSNLTEEKIRTIVEALNKYKIKFVRGYVTSIDAITSYADHNRIELCEHPTFIAGGEPLLESLKNRIVCNLGCNVVSQYANEENGILGQSPMNESGGGHELYLANCFVEVLKIDSDAPVEADELGRVVVTDYTNRAMPLIRYDIGDLAKVDSKTYDDEVTSFKTLVGRKTDMIRRTDGSFVDVFNSISPEIYNNPNVFQWQFIQHNKKNYELRLIVANSETKKKEADFVRYVRDVVGYDSEVNISFLDEIPIMNSGKRKVVIRECE